MVLAPVRVGTEPGFGFAGGLWKGPAGLSPALGLGKTRALALLGYFKKAIQKKDYL
jgi:hypothetical protein